MSRSSTVTVQVYVYVYVHVFNWSRARVQVLIGFKLAAVILSGSLAVVAVLVDNAVDLASGVVIWVSNVAVRKRNVHKYPQVPSTVTVTVTARRTATSLYSTQLHYTTQLTFCTPVQ